MHNDAAECPRFEWMNVLNHLPGVSSSKIVVRVTVTLENIFCLLDTVGIVLILREGKWAAGYLLGPHVTKSSPLRRGAHLWLCHLCTWRCCCRSWKVCSRGSRKYALGGSAHSPAGGGAEANWWGDVRALRAIGQEVLDPEADGIRSQVPGLKLWSPAYWEECCYRPSKSQPRAAARSYKSETEQGRELCS